MPKGYPRRKDPAHVDGLMMPTAKDIARWEASKASIQAKIKALSAQSDQLDALIAAAAPLIPAVPEQPPKPAPARRIKARKTTRRKAKRPKKSTPEQPQLPLPGRKSRGEGTWTGVIHNILAKAGRGLTHAELRAEIAKTALADRLEKSDKGFYGGIGKLADQNPPALAKYKGRLFYPPTYEKFMADVAAGKAADLEDIPQIGNASPFRDAIMDLMRSTFADNGATSAEIIAALKQNPALIGTVQRHPTHTYNVLARLLDHGELTKWNEKYFLGPKQRAA